MPDLSSSADMSFFDNVVPNQIFSVGNYSHIDKKHNSSIGQLTNPSELGYTNKIDQIVRVLCDPAIAQYQDRLLKKAVAEISADKVDIDHIRIGLNLTDNDVNCLLDKEKGLRIVRTKSRQKILRVKKQLSGKVNRGFKKSDLKPFFNIKFKLFIENDKYRYMNVYLATSDHPYNQKEFSYNCMLEFVPTRLTLEHISLMLFHIKSCLDGNRYKQLMAHAVLLRIDTGYVMHGVSQIFAFVARNNKKILKSSCIPSKQKAVETTYIGDRKAKHLIIYDKVLKENKVFVKAALKSKRIKFKRVAKLIQGIDRWFPSQAASVRIEYRDFVPKTPYKLSDMDTLESAINDTVWIRPSAICGLPEKLVRGRILNKSLPFVESMISRLNDVFEGDESKFLYRFDKDQVNRAFSAQLSKLKSVLFEPKAKLQVASSKTLITPKEQSKLLNYDTYARQAAQFLLPFVERFKSFQDDPKVIVSCSNPAIYVEGCPGSGKTDLIVKRVQYLVDSGVAPKHICVLSFTNQAANEFKERLGTAGLSDKEMFVGTFSAWCRQKLSGMSDVKVLSPKQAQSVMLSLIPEKGKLAEVFDRDELARQLLQVVDYKLNFDESFASSLEKGRFKQLAPFADKLKRILIEYQLWKDEHRGDFGDLLQKAWERLTNRERAKKLSKRYQHILLDEVQDTNYVQWNIIELMCRAGSHLFCVGDPAQSMFEFRGACDTKLRKFDRTFRNGKTFQLVDNYRSSPELVELANYLRSRINNQYSQSISKCASGPLPRVKQTNDFKSAVDWLIDELKSDDAGGDFLILCRYKKQRDVIRKRLKAEGLAANPEQHCHTYHGGKGKEANYCYVFDPLYFYFLLSSIKEELCNSYVAVTRAKKQLTILTSGRSDALYGSLDAKAIKPSIFGTLIEARASEIEILD